MVTKHRLAGEQRFDHTLLLFKRQAAALVEFGKVWLGHSIDNSCLLVTADYTGPWLISANYGRNPAIAEGKSNKS